MTKMLYTSVSHPYPSLAIGKSFRCRAKKRTEKTDIRHKRCGRKKILEKRCGRKYVLKNVW
ncbi:hypothetical protein [Methanosarcina horonobensis]|uniref:hypothetical protein n=1 Tax=Methanosarcina horonobensis TaxID=418008 RepID=UPI0022B911A5|nr:hypothetical protein [Methanosarcina horonobensis]